MLQLNRPVEEIQAAVGNAFEILPKLDLLGIVGRVSFDQLQFCGNFARRRLIFLEKSFVAGIDIAGAGRSGGEPLMLLMSAREDCTSRVWLTQRSAVRSRTAVTYAAMPLKQQQNDSRARCRVGFASVVRLVGSRALCL